MYIHIARPRAELLRQLPGGVLGEHAVVVAVEAAWQLLYQQ